jgi:hypothetical protein
MDADLLRAVIWVLIAVGCALFAVAAFFVSLAVR